MVELIEKLENDGTLRRLMDAGFITYKIILHKQLFIHHRRSVRGGAKVVDSVIDTAIEFKVSEQTVWRAIRTMSQK